MKTVTAIVGSPRRRGLTYTATRQFLDDLELFGDVKTEMVFVADYNLGLCRGCKTCFARGEECCPHNDDRDLLIEKMKSSDGVVFASPNYSFQVCAAMKKFLDRLGFVFHRPCFHGKAFTSIVVQGIHGDGKVVQYLDFVGRGLGFNVVKGSCSTALEPMTGKDRTKMEENVASQSARFHKQLFKPAYPAPSLFQLLVFRMSRTSMNLTLGDDNRDYTYYRDHGWFDSDYYYPARLGPLKRAAGSTFDAIAARMYKR